MTRIPASGGDDIGSPDMTECVLLFNLLSIGSTFLRDDHYYRVQSERSQVFSEKETLQKVYEALIEEHRLLQTNFDDVMHEKDDALARFRQLSRETDGRRNEKTDGIMRAEIERLRAEL